MKRDLALSVRADDALDLQRRAGLLLRQDAAIVQGRHVQHGARRENFRYRAAVGGRRPVARRRRQPANGRPVPDHDIRVERDRPRLIGRLHLVGRQRPIVDLDVVQSAGIPIGTVVIEALATVVPHDQRTVVRKANIPCQRLLRNLLSVVVERQNTFGISRGDEMPGLSVKAGRERITGRRLVRRHHAHAKGNLRQIVRRLLDEQALGIVVLPPLVAVLAATQQLAEASQTETAAVLPTLRRLDPQRIGDGLIAARNALRRAERRPVHDQVVVLPPAARDLQAPDVRGLASRR